MAGAVGNATLNFGATPGTNIVSVNVTGQASITGTSSVEAFMMGVDSTATHNTYEHAMAPIQLSCTVIPAVSSKVGKQINNCGEKQPIKIKEVYGYFIRRVGGFEPNLRGSYVFTKRCSC